MSVSTLLRLAVAALLVGAVVGCGGSDDGDGGARTQPQLPTRLAADFAGQADAIAARIDAGDVCEAEARARAFEEDVAGAIAAERLPRQLARELRAGVTRLVSQIECVPTVPEEPAEEGDEPPDDEAPDDEAPAADPTSCEALEARKEEIDAEKDAIKDSIEDEEERKTREKEREEEKNAIEQELKDCEREN